MDFEYNIAEDLDHAWLNFELDLPLEPLPGGGNNPFYVERPGNPFTRLKRELLRPFNQPPKLFFSGHRGCGKSTELNRLAANPDIQAKFWPIHFSIREQADINNLDFKEVLLAIGGQIFSQYTKHRKNKLPKRLLEELDSWRGKVVEEITTLQNSLQDVELEAKLNLFFAEIGGKAKLEPETRHIMRQVFDRNITGLVAIINDLTAAISAKEGKLPLVLIDDLDKPDLETAKAIFYERREIMLQPACPIVYTVSSPLFYSPEFEAIKDRAVFLPNIKLHTQGNRKQRDSEGYSTLRMYVRKRMLSDFISDDALDLAAEMSGGVFRELSRIMRIGIDRATLDGGRSRIEVQDVNGAAAEIRSSYWRILTSEQRQLLQQVRQHNKLLEPDKIAPLLLILAVLEYANGEPWCDVHPALNEMLDTLEA